MGTILVVDDDLTQQLIVFKILKTIGLNVIFADDGLQALEQVQRFCPNLVLLDILLPKMNGYEVCRRLKSDQKTQNLPVIMCSNKKEDCDHYWGIKQGADAYLSKPCHPQELVNTVQYFLAEGMISEFVPASVSEAISISAGLARRGNW
ncbi:response regulator [Microcoleus sp. FACHB-53]|nr:response regulator [Microcoleus sp. FACHB-53]MBD2125592.1 response regulator [Microcoleus sp. FACHB-1]